MLKTMTTLMLWLLLAVPAMADSKHEHIQELISLMNMEQQMTQMQALVGDLSHFEGMSDGERAIHERFQARMQALQLEEFGWHRLEPVLVELYDTYFTEQEIIDMIEFYRSPTGRRMIEISPMITEETMLFVQEASLRIGPRMQDLFKEQQAELAEYRRQARERAETKQ